MNILTFDIEEWWAYERDGRGASKDYIPRLNHYLDAVLDLLDEKGFKATFFCLGAMGEKYREPVRRIAERGHEIGCHSYSHEFFSESNPKVVEEDTRRAIKVLEDIVGQKITAYRAPAFSLTKKSAWMIEVLVSLGITCDSSVFPARRSYGGIPGFPSKQPCRIIYQGSALKEFPISTARLAGRDIAYSGGGYFRMLPYWFIRRVVTRSEYAMTYFHLMDFDKDQKRFFRSFKGENAVSRYFKNYYGLNVAFAKFEKLINDFSFVSMEAAEKEIDWDAAAEVELG